MMNVQIENVDLKTIQETSPPTEVERLFVDLDKPSLHALSYALRHSDTWPEDFAWHYCNCDTCAMGLAHQLWKQQVPSVNVGDGPSVMARVFAMPYEAAGNIFLSASWATETPGHQITPEMVADQIDKYLFGRS
jgi:hypothetical protein